MNNIKRHTSKIALIVTFFFSVLDLMGAQSILGPTLVPVGVPVSYFPVNFGNGCNNSIQWTIPSGTGTITNHGFFITVVWDCSVTSQRLLQAQLFGCSGYSGDYADLTVNVVSNIPAVPTLSGVNLTCVGETITYTANPVANATSYIWAVTGGIPATAITSSPSLSVLWNQSGTVSVKASSGTGCTSGANPALLVIVNNPIDITNVLGPIGGSPDLCGGTQGITYIANPIDTNVAHYIWTLPVGCNFVSASPTNGPSIQVNFDPYAQNGNITVTPIYDACAGTTFSLPIDVTVLPYPPAQIQGPLAVCEGTSANYSIPVVSNALFYDWDIVGGTQATVTTTTPNLSILWNTPGLGNIKVTPRNNCGVTPPLMVGSLGVIVHPNSTFAINDSVWFGNTQLGNLVAADLIFNHCSTSGNCPNKVLDKATLLLKFNTGEDYNYGSNPFVTATKVQIIGYAGLNNTGAQVISEIVDFNINENNPEQVYHYDFTSDYYQIQSFQIKILAYNGDPIVANDIQLTAQYQEEFKYNANSFSLPQTTLITSTVVAPIINSNQYNFSWENSCTDFLNYEFQLLRLFNNEPTNITTQNTINVDVIDWNEALSIETQSSQTNITLTLAEGTGYYAWRVRPIGDFYAGGIGNDKNWGLWSGHSGYEQGTINVGGSNGSSYAFFYTQFNEDINWIYSRTFTEGNLNEGKQIRVSENITFANGLQQARQTQAHLSTNNKILTTQTVNDFSGRPALSSMPVPLENKISLGFEPNFMKNLLGAVYTAEDFDADNNFLNPGVVNDAPGEHFAYYSNSNTDVTIPNAEQYPFTRTLFYNDGNSRVKEQSGVGETFKIKADLALSKTNKTFYAGVADDELIRVFGDEAPFNESVHKVINIDGNKTATVTYIGKDGKTLATCLARNGFNDIDDDAHALMGLESQHVAGFSVVDSINSTTPYGNFGNQATTTRTFVEENPTVVNVNYNLTPKSVQDICLDFCKTCDYFIEISVQNIEQPDSAYLFHSILLPAGICDSTNLSPYQIDTSVVLPKGTYVFTKRVVANNTDPNSVSVLNPIGDTYFEMCVDSVRNQYDSLIYGVGGQLEAINGYLDTADITGLYNYLGVDVDIANAETIFQDSTINIFIGCDSLAIPIIVCNPKLCPLDESFADYFDAFWVDSIGDPIYTFASVSDDNTGYAYANINFDNMIHNMLDSTSTNPYKCDSLWDCWYSVVQNYEQLVTMYNNPALPAGASFNIVEAFLDCAGRRITRASLSSTWDREYAYEEMNYVLGSNLDCEGYLCEPQPLTAQPIGCNNLGQDNTGTPWTGADWNEFYNCVTHTDLNPTSPVADPNNPVASAQAMTDTCEVYCELKKAGYIDVIIQAYHQDSLYVAANPDTDTNAIYPFSGDIYTLEYVSVIDMYQFNDTDSLDLNTTAFIDWETIECMANSLVQNCKEGCVVTPIFDTITGDLLSMGTPEEIIAFTNSLTGAYEVSVTCAPRDSIPWDTISSGAGGVVSWTYGGTGDDRLWDMKPTADGGYILVGTTKSTNGDVVGNHGMTDVFVVKITAYGSIQWTKTLGGSNEDHDPRHIIPLADGYLIGALTRSVDGNITDRTPSEAGSIDMWLIKLTLQGNIDWQKTYGSSYHDDLNDIKATSDGGFIMVGQIFRADGDFNNVSFNGASDISVLKVDSVGTIEWARSLGGSGYDAGKGVLALSSGSYIVTGADGSSDVDFPNSYGSYDLAVAKLDIDGNTVWTQEYGGSGFEERSNIIEIDGGEIIIAGRTTSTDGDFGTNDPRGQRDYFAIKLDSTNGSKVWSKNYGGAGDDVFFRVKNTSNNEFLMIGYTTSSNSGDVPQNGGSADGFVLRVDANGNIIESKTVGSYTNEVLFRAYETGPDCYIYGGYSGTSNLTPNHNGFFDYWVYAPCDSMCTFNDFCFRYVPFPVIPDSIPVILPLTCDEVAANDIANSIEHVTYEYIEEKVAAFEANYMNTCVNPDSINDNFWLTYPLGYHHYTLYYYNRAGSLIKTVPPSGVDLLDRDAGNDNFDAMGMNRNTSPYHRFITDYEYNSLGQLIKQHTPDGGTSDFYYNSLGQLRFSQNAQQLSDETYSYTKYDKLGRIIEVGESTQAAPSGDFVISVDTASFPTPPIGNLSLNSQITYTAYTDKAAVTYLNSGMFKDEQRYLLNRISYTYTDDDGQPTVDDRTYTYYSYDPHGNVEWLIQDIPGFLGKQYVRYEYDLVSGNVLKVCYNENKIDQFYHRYSYDADNRITLAETSINDVTWEKDAGYEYYTHGPLQRTKIGEDKVQGLDYVYTIHGWLKALNHASLDKTLDPGNDGTNGTNNFAKDVFAMQLGYFTGDFNRSGSPFNSANTSTLNPAGSRSLYNGNITTWASNNMQHPNSNDPYPGLTAYAYRYDELNRIKTADFKENVAGSSFNSTPDYGTTYRYDGNGNLSNLTRNGNTVGANPLNMDNLFYRYYDGNGNVPTTPLRPQFESNKLAFVTDSAGSTTYGDDLESQALNNYDYDNIGNLIKDDSEEIAEIKWTVYGKVKEIIRTPTSSKPNLKFIYDASGNRIAKIVIPNVVDATPSRITWYSRDASGNVMAIYESVYDATATGITESIYLKEQPIYGSSRVGERKDNLLIKTVDYSLGGSPTVLPGNLNVLLTEHTNMLIGVRKPSKGAKQTVNFTNPATPQVSSVNNIFGGKQGRNGCVVEDNFGNVVFSAFTARKIGNTNNVCRVLDANNNVMTLPSIFANTIKSNWEGKMLGMKKHDGNNPNLYYLFTVGTDRRAYYHVIDVALGQVISVNNLIPSANKIGLGMALVDDGPNENGKLYLRKHNNNTQTAQILTYMVTSTGITQIGTTPSFDSGDKNGIGAIQISPNGLKLAITNQQKRTGSVLRKGEIRVYNLDANYNVTNLHVTVNKGFNDKLGSIDFSPTSENLYYSIEQSAGGTQKSINKYNLTTTTDVVVISGDNGEVRRAKDGNMYVAVYNQTGLQQIINPDATFSVTSLAVTSNAWKITGGISLQPHKILKLDNNLITRVLDKKTYEINDHLGSVRAIVSDVKESTIVGGIPQDFEPDILATNSYYSFGSLQPGRHFGTENSRYGFNGMEKDDEMHGVSGSSYDFGARLYDSRLGRWFSPDKKESSHADMSPYNFALNNPLIYLDPDGEDTLYVHAQVMDAANGTTKLFKLTFSVVIEGVETYLELDLPEGPKSAYLAVQKNLWTGGNVWYPDGASTDVTVRFESYDTDYDSYSNSIRLKYVSDGKSIRVLAHKGSSTYYSLGCNTPTCDPSQTTEGGAFVKGVNSQEILDAIRKLYDEFVPSEGGKNEYARDVQTPTDGNDFLIKTESIATMKKVKPKKVKSLEKGKSKKAEPKKAESVSE